jgi:hypothetical protein
VNPLLDGAERTSEPAVGETDRPVRASEVEAQVRDLLVRLTAQEHAAEEAQPRPGDFFGWPAWSMDTGLSRAQEKFVEHWSPQRVLDDSRSVRQLVGALQRWSSTPDRDVDLHEALGTFATLQAR